jgi:hypothetical protein
MCRRAFLPLGWHCHRSTSSSCFADAHFLNIVHTMAIVAASITTPLLVGAADGVDGR